jgi:hypothetical protein
VFTSITRRRCGRLTVLADAGAGARPARAHLDPRTASDLIEDVFSAAGNQTVFAEHPSQAGLDRVHRVVSMAADEMTASQSHT